jgi:CRP/FNR family transcriptional regulator
MNQSSGFRRLVFEGYSRRITTLMSKIEELICTRIDVRLAERLLELMGVNHCIETTQQALAADLGTAREVIGRMLNSFERSGWVKLSRGAIEIRDASALSMLIGGKRD